VGLERGPLSLESATEELLGRNSNSSGLQSRDYGRRGSAALTALHPSIRKSLHFVDKRRSLGQYSFLADSGHWVCFFYIIRLRGKMAANRSQCYIPRNEAVIETVEQHTLININVAIQCCVNYN
jgi:hypothetical protein